MVTMPIKIVRAKTLSLVTSLLAETVLEEMFFLCKKNIDGMHPSNALFFEGVLPSSGEHV